MVISSGLIITSTQTLRATSIQDEKDKQEEMQSELNDMQAALEELESLKNDTEAYITQLDVELAEVSGRVVDLNNQASEKQAEIDETNGMLAQQEADMASQYEAMKMRIRFMYENGDSDYIDMILGSSSIGDMLNKAEYITQITEYDRSMLDKMRVTLESIEQTKENLEQEQNELTELLNAAQTEQANVEMLVQAKQEQLLSTQAKIDSASSDIQNKETELAEQASLIAEMEEIERRRAEEAERRRREEAERQAALQNGNNANNSGGSAGAPVIKYDGGKFTWPVPGVYRITSDYGYRGDPFGVSSNSEFHKGIDIGAPAGTPIVSTYDGEVAWAYYSNSAGNWVGIDHGDGIYSVYMHMSYSVVSEGQYVKAGQVIGYVGTTGNSTGNHLHFAIRKNGSYVNPHDYVG